MEEPKMINVLEFLRLNTKNLANVKLNDEQLELFKIKFEEEGYIAIIIYYQNDYKLSNEIINQIEAILPRMASTETSQHVNGKIKYNRFYAWNRKREAEFI
jgi:hypothetical protein